MTKTITYFKSTNTMAAGAVKIFKAAYGRALLKNGRFSVVLSGGQSPLPFFRLLAGQKGLDWDKIFFFFADERMVGPGSKYSNYKAAHDLLFSKTDVPRSNIFAMPAPGRGTPAGYERSIRAFFGGRPAFDLVFLGLGPDGHTASLFPGSPALHEHKKLAATVSAPPGFGPRKRVTLTFKALNSAGTIVFLVSGKGKKDLFRALAAGEQGFPAAGIKPAEKLYLFYTKGE